MSDWIKVVVFVEGEGASVLDEKWRRFQLVLPAIAYKKLKQAILEVAKEYDP